MKLIEEMKSYKPWNTQEIQDKANMMRYLSKEKNLYSRENERIHITASPWIINSDNTKVLMIHHNIYQSWAWCGGHADGDKNLLQVACREGKEETGVLNLYPYDGTIFAIDILPVPVHKKHGTIVKAHFHMNITYLYIADEKESLHNNPEENSGVMWIDKDKINDYVKEEKMKPVYLKLKEKTDFLYKSVSYGNDTNISPFNLGKHVSN